MWTSLGDARKLRDAERAAESRAWQQAGALADDVEREPFRTRALAVRAHAELATGTAEEAVGALEEAVSRQPNSWWLHRDHAFALLASGQRAEARKAMMRARELNPRMQALPAFSFE